MHKCLRCGQEFEGRVCPNCGLPWQEIKTCPNCGVQLLAHVKFCPDCGYSFKYRQPYTQTPTQTETQAKKKSGFKSIWAWIKSHLKIVIPSLAALIVVIIMLSLIPTFIAIPSNGTYYKCYDGKYDTDSYITLKNYKWSDDEGSSGKYKLSGNKIKVYISMFGETDVYSGKVKNGVLQLDTDGDGEFDETYVRTNHKHKFGNWKIDYEATCTEKGKATHICDCGFKDSIEIELTPHTGNWITENGQHWKICTICGQEFDKGECENINYCSVCRFQRLYFDLNSDKLGYTIYTPFDSNINYGNMVIPTTYNNLPITAIGDQAFFGGIITNVTIPDSVTSIGKEAFGQSSLISITIPNSVTSIGEAAFNNCRELESVTIGNGVTSIGAWAFSYCDRLESITVTNGNKKYHSANNCLIETDSKTLIAGCKNSTIPTDGSITSIGTGAFANCSSLISITIPNSITSIGIGAFANCSSLISINLPNSISFIGDSAFYYCTDITTINYEGTIDEWNSISKKSDWNQNTSDFTVQCTDGKLDKKGYEIND